jgi:hypothetical protein
LWVQLFGLSRDPAHGRNIELRGGIAVESCLPFTRSPDKPWDWAQASVWWQSIQYRYQPGQPAPAWAGATSHAYLDRPRDLIDVLSAEGTRFCREVDARFASSADVREALWEGSIQSDPRQGMRHLAVLLAAERDWARLAEVREKLGSDAADLVEVLWPEDG